MAIIFKLADNSEYKEYNQSHFEHYNADIERQFGPFRDHEAVVLARAPREQHGTGYSNVMGIAIRVTDPPELRQRVPFDSAAGWPAPAAQMRRFIAGARRFTRKARPTHSSRPIGCSTAPRTPGSGSRSSAQGAFEWFGLFFGVPPDRDVVIGAGRSPASGAEAPP